MADPTRLFQAKLAIVLLDNRVALAGGAFKFLAIHDLHCATGVLDDLFFCKTPAAKLTLGRSVPSIVARKS